MCNVEILLIQDQNIYHTISFAKSLMRFVPRLTSNLFVMVIIYMPSFNSPHNMLTKITESLITKNKLHVVQTEQII